MSKPFFKYLILSSALTLLACSNNTDKRDITKLDKKEFLTCHSYLIKFRAESLFANVKYDEITLMQELQTFHAEKNKRGISDLESGSFGLAINAEVNGKYTNSAERLSYANQKSIECGQKNKL
jgi:hypothetical protein